MNKMAEKMLREQLVRDFTNLHRAVISFDKTDTMLSKCQNMLETFEYLVDGDRKDEVEYYKARLETYREVIDS